MMVMIHQLMVMVPSIRCRIRALSQGIELSALIATEHSLRKGMLARADAVSAPEIE